MGAVALDADVLIGFLEPTDAQHDRAVELLASFLAPGHRLYIGASVYAEALVRPLQLGRPEVVEDFLSAARVEIVPVDESVARVAAGLRAEHRSLRLPDALSLACALARGAALLTFDERLGRLAAEHT